MMGPRVRPNADAGVGAEEYRRLFGHLPATVAVVTAIDEDGEPRGLTCSAVTAVSLDPPLLLVCVDRRSRTLPAIRFSASFAVNFLDSDAHEVSRRFAGERPDKFADIPYRPGACAGGAPILTRGVAAVVECTVERSLRAGDHWVFVGHIRDCSVAAQTPLLHRAGAYGTWAAADLITEPETSVSAIAHPPARREDVGPPV